MNSWLKEIWEFLIEPWVSPLALMILAILMGLLLRFNFYLGGWAEARETAVWRGLVLAPEPEVCALCGGGRYHAPCLVNLATGEVGELRIYDLDPEREDSTVNSPAQTRSVFYFTAGVCAFCDENDNTCTAQLPEKTDPVTGTYFCRNCRAKLADIAAGGFVLADLYDLAHIRIYPVTPGAEYGIRNYTVRISQDEKTAGLNVLVSGKN